MLAHASAPPDHILTRLLLDLRYPALRAHYLQSNYGMTLWPCVFQEVSPPSPQSISPNSTSHSQSVHASTLHYPYPAHFPTAH